MSAKLDPYRVLQVRPDAAQEEIKLAFRRLARRYHPDRVDDAISNARMIDLNQAWELLGDPVRRAAYDRAHGIVVRSNRHASDPGSASFAETPPPDEDSERTGGQETGSATAAGPGASSTASGDPRSGAPASSAAADLGRIPPPVRPGGRATGTLVPFGRYEGWTLGEIARVEPEYLEWLVRMPIGWQYRNEIGELLAARAAGAPSSPSPRPGQARRRGFLGR